MTPATEDEPTIGDRYRNARERLTAYLREQDESAWERPVPACPGWNVRDVLAHLVGVVEDSAAGLLSGPPGPDQTAVEVERHRENDPEQLLQAWTELAPRFEAAITANTVWPALIDVLSHEHDIRGALGSVDHRDHPDLRRVAELLRGGLPDVRISFGEDGDDPSRLRLRTDRFEFFRLRLGRRSRRQVERLDWSTEPGPLLDALFVFGPAEIDIVE
ncbi:MAG: maleylpyruvate isomerase family mycothiol-dependent enzyme [Acidimicrobiales bacterium]